LKLIRGYAHVLDGGNKILLGQLLGYAKIRVRLTCRAMCASGFSNSRLTLGLNLLNILGDPVIDVEAVYYTLLFIFYLLQFFMSEGSVELV
jgi:hypothetical protein